MSGKQRQRQQVTVRSCGVVWWWWWWWCAGCGCLPHSCTIQPPDSCPGLPTFLRRVLIVLNVTELGQCEMIGNSSPTKVPEAAAPAAPAAGGHQQLQAGRIPYQACPLNADTDARSQCTVPSLMAACNCTGMSAQQQVGVFDLPPASAPAPAPGNMYGAPPAQPQYGAPQPAGSSMSAVGSGYGQQNGASSMPNGPGGYGHQPGAAMQNGQAGYGQDPGGYGQGGGGYGQGGGGGQGGPGGGYGQGAQQQNTGGYGQAPNFRRVTCPAALSEC